MSTFRYKNIYLYKLINDTKNSSITQQYKSTDAEVVLVQNDVFQQYFRAGSPQNIYIFCKKKKNQINIVHSYSEYIVSGILPSNIVML